MLRNPHLPLRSQKSTKPHAPIPNTSSIASKIAACPSPSLPPLPATAPATEVVTLSISSPQRFSARNPASSDPHSCPALIPSPSRSTVSSAPATLCSPSRADPTIPSQKSSDWIRREKKSRRSAPKARSVTSAWITDSLSFSPTRSLPKNPLTSPRWLSSSDGTERR